MELSLHDQLIEHWKKLIKREARVAKKGDAVSVTDKLEVKFIPSLLREFLEVGSC
jgi:hypothetical protein